MILPIALVAVVALGFLGQPAAAAARDLMGFAPAVTLVLLYLAVFAVGAVLLRQAAARVPQTEERERGPDDPWETGTMRGSEPLRCFLGTTLVVAALAVVVGGVDLSATAAAACAVLAGWFARPLVETWRAASLVTRPLSGPDRRPSSALPEVADHSLPDPTDRVRHDYRWTHASGLDPVGAEPTTYALSLVCSKTRCAEQAARSREDAARDPAAYGTYVSEGLTSEIRRCAEALVEKATTANMPLFDLIDFVLSFVRGVIQSPAAGEVARVQFPLETLVARQGTTADAAVLAATLLHCMGAEPILVVLRSEDSGTRVGVGVPSDDWVAGARGTRVQFEGRAYWYAQARPPGGWHLGELPQRPGPCEVMPVPIE